MTIRFVSKGNKNFQLLLSFFVAYLGALLFSLLHLPIPWLLGSMTAILVSSRFTQFTFRWPNVIRDIGLMIVGYSIGITLNKDTLLGMLEKLPSMLFMTLCVILFCSLMAYVISKVTNIEYPTALTATIPGGLSQILILSQELKGIDITIVAFFQVTRMLMIVFTVPFIIMLPTFLEGTNNTELSEVVTSSVSKGEVSFFTILIFVISASLFAIIGKKMKMPTSYLLGPIISTAILNMSGFHAPGISVTVLEISQFMIGGYIGLLLKPEKLLNKTKMITIALVSSMFLITASLCLSMILSNFYHFSFITSFLSLAPGGMEQMTIIAHDSNADITMVTGYQLFRILFIYFIVPPILTFVVKMSLKQKTIELTKNN